MIDAVSLDAGSPVPSRPDSLSGGVSPLADGFAAAAENLESASQGLKPLDSSAVDRFRAAMGETASADELLAYAFAPPPRNAEAAAEAVPARPGETFVQPTPQALSSTPADEVAPDPAAVPETAAAPERTLPPDTVPAEVAPAALPEALPATSPAAIPATPETPDADGTAPVAPGAVPADGVSAAPAAAAVSPRRPASPVVAASPAASPAAAAVSPRRKAVSAEEPSAVPAAPPPLQAAPAVPVPSAAADVAPVAAPGAVRAAEATAAAARTHEIAEAVESVVAAMEVTPGLAQGNGEIRITLRPDVLDGSEIRLAVDGDALSVQVAPATGEVAALVERNIASFEQSLAERVPSFQIAVSVAPRRVRGRDDA